MSEQKSVKGLVYRVEQDNSSDAMAIEKSLIKPIIVSVKLTGYAVVDFLRPLEYDPEDGDLHDFVVVRDKIGVEISIPSRE